MSMKTWAVALCAILALAGCSRTWEVNYDQNINPDVSQDWRVETIVSVVPESLTVSDSNTYAPSGDIVWWGEPFGDRREQVARIFDEGIAAGTADLNGDRPVRITATVERFHAVTPAAVAAAPAAVHNIRYRIQVFDVATSLPLTANVPITADLEAYVGAAAMASAIRGEDQRVRIVNHIAEVTRGWIGSGPDQRRTFRSIGR